MAMNKKRNIYTAALLSLFLILLLSILYLNRPKTRHMTEPNQFVIKFTGDSVPEIDGSHEIEIIGTVVDAQDSTAVEGARISIPNYYDTLIDGRVIEAFSDAKGHFKLKCVYPTIAFYEVYQPGKEYIFSYDKGLRMTYYGLEIRIEKRGYGENVFDLKNIEVDKNIKTQLIHIGEKRVEKIQK